MLVMTEDNDQTQNSEQDYITLVDEDGNEELYQILLTFESEQFDKNYVLVYPAGAEDDEVELYAFSYEEDEEGLEGELDEIETEEEWDMIEEVLGTFMADDEEE